MSTVVYRPFPTPNIGATATRYQGTVTEVHLVPDDGHTEIQFSFTDGNGNSHLAQTTVPEQTAVERQRPLDAQCAQALLLRPDDRISFWARENPTRQMLCCQELKHCWTDPYRVAREGLVGPSKISGAEVVRAQLYRCGDSDFVCIAFKDTGSWLWFTQFGAGEYGGAALLAARDQISFKTNRDLKLPMLGGYGLEIHWAEVAGDSGCKYTDERCTFTGQVQRFKEFQWRGNPYVQIGFMDDRDSFWVMQAVRSRVIGINFLAEGKTISLEAARSSSRLLDRTYSDWVRIIG
jgi:hypothetical protein